MPERFAVYNTMMGETLAVVEMDENLLRPEANIVDPESLTMRPIKGGGVYTLVPVADHTVSALKRLHTVFLNIKEKTCPSMATMIGRTDNLIEAVETLFGEVEYTVIESVEDMTLLLNPGNSEHEFKKSKHTILGDMLEKVLAENNYENTNDE